MTTIAAKKPRAQRTKRVQVYLRVRPMVASEVERKDAPLSLTEPDPSQLTLTTPPTPNDDIEFVEVLDGIMVPKSKPKRTRTFRGLSGTFREASTNADIYAAVVAPLVDEALAGRAACCFAYGHTGSGKTHTILGYNDEPGLYRLASHALFAAIAAANELIDVDADRLHVQVRFNEIYNGDVYDLLNDRAKCFVREDELGKVHIRSATTTGDDGLVYTSSSTTKAASSLDDLTAIVADGLATRKTGNSNVHAQSSRSHAVLEVELVTTTQLQLATELETALANTTRVGHERDSLEMGIFVRQHDKVEGKWVRKPDAVGATTDECDLLRALAKEVKAHKERASHLREASNELKAQANALGGALIFVDLAGSEHAGRTSDGIVKSETEQNECREINKSLSALQSCFRAQAKGLASGTTYRSSKLTMVLRDHLRSAGSTTRMIATLSPSSAHTTQTIQTLQYAQLVGQV
ncbi:hypothetical protein SPRG_19206 [Saprolegnia parasitica CBS 223.65]|uniref:Kinesin motor domain-containing protein n=1 Tax=Saprolegnia parasitica (strain CBS 223.65) TaxID=695850 RepID=A0A067D4C5_SAPPC|nr:hypothetical protein SPRG_19206 [Saprolegnia parasitica CBS 223.65]KDO33576.1 hypothetical protein SPRG_19206 [Saprolegnia parasitica CBS 223.65]|eukprot:XP_012195629.1 hypothetical protein SPRG_19206 [Saprolegnia parasitica CBS 223.65]